MPLSAFMVHLDELVECQHPFVPVEFKNGLCDIGEKSGVHVVVAEGQLGCQQVIGQDAVDAPALSTDEYAVAVIFEYSGDVIAAEAVSAVAFAVVMVKLHPSDVLCADVGDEKSVIAAAEQPFIVGDGEHVQVGPGEVECLRVSSAEERRFVGPCVLDAEESAAVCGDP